MTTISPEAFMAQPTDVDEDVEDDFLALSGRELQLSSEYDNSALAYITGALMRIEDQLRNQSGADVVAAEMHEALLTQGERYEDLLAEHAALQALVEEIETIIKPSVSKLANEVRAAITAWRVGDSEEDQSKLPMPAHDADVEAWREYAIAEGIPRADAESLNRSQIRTMLGIEQPVEGGA